MRSAQPAPPPSLDPFIEATPGVQNSTPSSVRADGNANGGGDRAVASFSGSQDMSERDHRKRNGDPSLLSATALTLQSSCRCPHLDAILPHILRLDRYDPVVELHLGGHFGDVAPVTAAAAAAGSSSARAASLPAASATTASASGSRASSPGSRSHHHHHRHRHHDNNHHKAKEGEARILPFKDPPSSLISSIKSPSSSVPAAPVPALTTGTTATNPATTSTSTAAKAAETPSSTKASHLPKNVTTAAVSSKSQRADRAVFGPEHARLLAIAGRGGAASSWCPVLPPLYQPSGSLGRYTYGSSSSGGDGNDRNGGDRRKKKSSKKRKAAAIGAEAAKAGMEETKSANDETKHDAVAAATAGVSAVDDPLANAVSGGVSAAAAPVVAQTGAITSNDTVTASDPAPPPAAPPPAVDTGTQTKSSADPCTASSESGTLPPSAPAGIDSKVGESNRSTSEKKNEGAEAEPVPSALDTAAVTSISGTSSTIEASGMKDTNDSSQKKEPKRNSTNSEAATRDSLNRPENVSGTAAPAGSPASTRIDEQEETTKDSMVVESKDYAKGKQDVPDASSAGATAASDVNNEINVQESLSAAALEVESSVAKNVEASISDVPVTKSVSAEPMDIDNRDTSNSLNPPQGEALSLPSTGNLVQAAASKDTRISSAEKTENIPDSVSKGGEDNSSEDVSPTTAEASAVGQDARKSVDASGANPTTENVLSDTSYLLSDSRYSQLRSRERRLMRERENVLLRSREMPSPSDICLPSTGQPKQTRGPTKRYNDDTVSKASTTSLTTSMAVHVVSDDEFSSERRMLRSRASVASSKVEEWLEVIRGGRKAYFDGERVEHSRSHCAWCPRPSNKTEFIKNRHPSGDELMQCLECSVVGCGPNSTCPDSSMHMMCHFIASGHQFGMTCGPRAEIFCAKCGDFVYHEVFDQEKERIEIAQFVPQYGWEASPLRRSYEPLSFISTPDHGIVWRGMMATYPTPVPLELVVAGRLSLKRILMFSGKLEAGGGAETWGPLALRLAISQSQLGTACCKIKAPIGLYNLGNTCFMSSVLQCLVNCAPIQRYFLREVRHNFLSCKVLRSAHGASPSSPLKSNCRQGEGAGICIACEMDRLLLEYYGRTIGDDVIAALEEGPSLSSSCVSNAANAAAGRRCGEPLVPARLLAATWKSGGMKHLAGYQQRDAHEFLSAFLDSMGKHDRCSNIISKMRDGAGAHSISQQEMERNSRSIGSDNIVKYLFAGKLRSVLICMTCGYKRSQPEPFLDVSLPITADTKTIESSLRNFTRPEELSDSVLCPSCAIKTPTRKQHTFAKLPKILCLHLKRFDAATNRKISDFVSFPAHGLNLGAFLPHWCEVVEGMKNPDPDAVQNEADAACPQILYDLYATVNHTGTLHQGHYVSNVKVNGKWYHCNDAYVCDAGDGDGEKAVLEADGAYMLFYMRRDVVTT